MSKEDEAVKLGDWYVQQDANEERWCEDCNGEGTTDGVRCGTCDGTGLKAGVPRDPQRS